jgi:hypothetical protein
MGTSASALRVEKLGVALRTIAYGNSRKALCSRIKTEYCGRKVVAACYAGSTRSGDGHVG